LAEIAIAAHKILLTADATKWYKKTDRAAAEADTQFTIFDLSALKKLFLIFLS